MTKQTYISRAAALELVAGQQKSSQLVLDSANKAVDMMQTCAITIGFVTLMAVALAFQTTWWWLIPAAIGGFLLRRLWFTELKGLKIHREGVKAHQRDSAAVQTKIINELKEEEDQ